jgi:multidrug efflux pump subunit AcrA (membrane-fusion protein)
MRALFRFVFIVALLIAALSQAAFALQGDSAAIEIGHPKKQSTSISKYEDASEPEKIPLVFTLDDLVSYGFRHNLSVSQLETALIRKSLARDATLFVFDPRIGISATAFHRESAGSTSSATQSGVAETEGLSFDFTYTKPLESGDQIQLRHSFNMTDVSITSATIPKTWGGSLGATYTMPLGKDRGEISTMLAYLTQDNEVALAYMELDNERRQLAGSVASAYYNAVYMTEAVKAGEESLEYYRRLVDRNTERYKVGLGLRTEVLQAENAMLSQETSLVDLRASLKDAIQSLEELIGYSEGAPLEIEPLDTEGFIPSELHHRDLWQSVIDASFALKQIENQKKNLGLTERYYENQMRPDLSLSASASTQGEDSAFSGVYGELTAAQSYSLTLNYALPWGKREIKSKAEQNRLQAIELDARRKQITESLRTQYDRLRRELESTLTGLEFASSNVTVAEENASITRERQRVGLATTLDVLETEKNLLNAKLTYLRAISDHKRADFSLRVLAGLAP